MATPLLRARAASAAVATLVLLTACGEQAPAGDGSTTGSSSGATSGASAPATPEPDPSGTTAPAPVEAEPPGAEAQFGADTEDDVAEPAGGPLSVVAVRAAAHGGYDRVVFELAGEDPGRPGWRVGYVEAPGADGSGDPVEVAGEAYLQVMITGTGYPEDTGQDLFTGTTEPAGTAVVRQVVTRGVFEGQTQAFVGLTEPLPFRVFALADPPRVVVDVRTP